MEGLWDGSASLVDSLTSVVKQVKNAVMQYTEFEVKVREATSNESCKSFSYSTQKSQDPAPYKQGPFLYI
jgi:hypothetical protein